MTIGILQVISPCLTASMPSTAAPPPPPPPAQPPLRMDNYNRVIDSKAYDRDRGELATSSDPNSRLHHAWLSGERARNDEESMRHIAEILQLVL